MGGPDLIDGKYLFAIESRPPAIPMWLQGTIFILLFSAAMLILYFFAPKPDAWLTRLAQRLGAIITIIVLVLVAILIFAGFNVVLFLSGNPLFLRDLTTIVFCGILGGGFLQFMDAAILPNPNSGHEQRMLEETVESARGRAIEQGHDPDEAEKVARHYWAKTGQQIGQAMQFLHGLIAALGGGGVHGGILFVFGASFFIGLGLGVSGSAVSLFYFVPLLVALADTATIYAGNASIRRVGNRKRKSWAAALALPIGVIGMLSKAGMLVGGAVILRHVGGPDIPWRLYWEAALAEPFGQGLTVTAILLVGFAWPILLFVGPAHREFSH